MRLLPVLPYLDYRLGMRWLMITLALTACQGDETLSAYGAAQRDWRLVEMDGQAVKAPVTLRFPEAGQITGTGPCNSFSATQTAPYPWFGIGPIASTRSACPNLAAEAAFFRALEAMELAEVLGDTLILSTAQGRQMLFKAAE